MNLYSRMATGLGVGSFVYLVSIFFQKSTVVTSKSIVFVFLIALFVSVTTIIFDIERLGFNTALLLHYLCAVGFILPLNDLFFGIENFLSFFISLTVIYAVSYGVTQVKLILTVKELNKYVKDIENNR